MKQNHTASSLLTCAGALMTLSGILMTICVRLAYGGIFLAAASCMFFAAYHFRQQENRKDGPKPPGSKPQDP